MPDSFEGERAGAAQAVDSSISTSKLLEAANSTPTTLKGWDDDLNKAYKTLQSAETTEQKQLMTDSQRQWLTFRDADEDAIFTIIRQGPATRPEALQAQLELTKERAIELDTRASIEIDAPPLSDRLGAYWHHGNMYLAEFPNTDVTNPLTYKAIDAQLNQVYQAILPNLDDDKKATLVKSEKEWIKFRDKEFAAIDKTDYDTPRLAPIERALDKIDIVKERTKQLQVMLDSVRN